MAWLRWVTLGVALAAYAGACSYPEFMYTTGASSSGAGGNGGGAGITTSASVSSTGPGASTVSSGSGNPAACRLLHDAEDCPGQRCTIQDESTGKTHCAPIDASALLPYDACEDDTLCPQATFCDHHTKVCKPICNGASDCPSTNCAPAKTSGGSIITGLGVCLAHCDPINLDPCGIGTTCEYDKNAGDLDCLRTIGLQPGDMCTHLNDCIGGYVCVGTCEPWCFPADTGTTCFSGECIEFLNLLVTFNSQSYGYICP